MMDRLALEERQALPNPFESNSAMSTEVDPIVESISESISEGPPAKPPNFPAIMPIVYHSVGLEIPQKYSYIVRFAYIGVKSFFWCLLLSVIAEVFSDKIRSVYIYRWRELILSAFILLICPIGLLYGQYFPLYCSIRDEKRSRALVPFQMFTIFVMVFMLLGIPGTGIVGIGYTVVAFQCGTIVNKIFGVICSLWHLVNVVMQAVLLVLIGPFANLPRRIANPVDL